MRSGMSLIASCTRPAQAGFIAGLVLVIAACVSGCAVPERGPAPVLYDFGDRPLTEVPAPKGAALASLATSVQASAALDGTAMLYRLSYADERQLRAYAQARWAMPPAELVHQRLREVLSAQRVVLRPGEGAAWVLQIELEEFSQVFEAPGQSSGLLRLRATVLQATPAGHKLMAQRSIVMKRPAPGGGAAGGVRALSAATDAAADELAQWLQQLR
jgi:cholesterol transport system auxiliary component